MSHAKRASPPAPGKPVFQPMDPAIMAVTIEEQRRMLERYKYTEEQMLKAIQGGVDEGWRGGWRAGMTEMLKCAYAAVSVVMHEQYGFGAERLLKLLKAIDQRIETTIEHSDLLAELSSAGIELDLSDPMERISIRGPAKGGRRKCQD